MKRIPLVTLLVLVLAMVVAGCGLLSQKTEPTSSVPPAKEDGTSIGHSCPYVS